MPVYRLPSADLVRDALLAGAVPPAVARQPVAAAVGPRLLVELPAAVREFFTRRGATPEPAPPALALGPCWAVLVPLVADDTPVAGPTLVPGRRPGPVYLGDDGRAWVVSTRPADGYRPAGPGVWVRAGWRHPAAAHLAPPVGSQLLLADRPLRPVGVFHLPPAAAPTAVERRHRLPVRPTRGGREPATLWVRPGSPADVAGEVVAELGVEAAGRFDAAAIGPPSTALVRVRDDGPLPVGWADGWCAVPGADGLYIPHGRKLPPAVARIVVGWAESARPTIAPTAPMVGLEDSAHPTTEGPYRVTWLADDSRTVHTAVADFRPLAGWVRVVGPVVARLAERVAASPFEPVIVQPEPASRPDEIAPPPAAARRTRTPPLARTAQPAATALPAAKPALPPAAPIGRLVGESARLEAVERAGLWADAGCWLNAVWCHPDPPAGWLAAATFPEGREADRPVRAVWLDHLARHRSDPLAMARCRDRLLARLDRGPRLDLDVPAFLRRSARGPDPAAVRDWLTAITGPVRKWVHGCGDGSRLTRDGLDADRAATRRYADLILAWGSAAAGDATAVSRADLAVAALTALRRPADVEPAVHRLLGGEFTARVRDALDAEPTPRHAPDLTTLTELGRYAAERLLAANDGTTGFTTTAVVASAADARSRHRPDSFRTLLATLDPATALAAAASLFRAAEPLGLVEAVAVRVAGQQPTVGGRRDLGLAVGRFLLGDAAGGERSLDAARQRLFVAGVPDLRKRGELAAAYATAVGYGAPGLVHGRLDELVRRLGPVSAAGACGRYFALLPLRVVDAVVRAAVGGDFALSPAVRQFLADEERLTRCRIHRDMRTLLRDV